MNTKLVVFILTIVQFHGIHSNKINIQLNDNIIKLFTEINAGLDVLKNVSYMPRIDYAVNNYNAFEPQEQCTVTEDSLKELKQKIDNTLNNLTSIKNPVNCNYDTKTDPNLNCQELISLIQCGVNHMQEAYSNAFINSVSLVEYQKLLNAFIELEKQYQKNLDEMKASISQEYQLKISELISKIQKLNEALNQVTNRLKEALVELAAFKIKDGKISEAVLDWKKVNDEPVALNITRLSYNLCTNYGSNDNTKYVMEFLYNIRNYLVFYDAYNLFMNLVRTRNPPINDPTVAILAYALHEKKFTSDYKLRLQDTINIWSNQISSNQLNNIDLLMISLEKNYVKELEKLKILTEIVPKVYSGENAPSANDGFQKMCNFIDKFKSNTLKTEGYNAMISRISNFDNLNSIKLALRVLAAGVSLISRFPKGIYNLVWPSNRCFIRNSFYNEYVYAVQDHYAFDKDRRRVLSWTPGTGGWQFDWKIEVRYDGNKDDEPEFSIKNVAFSEYLYAPEYKKLVNGYRRTVVTWRPKVLEGNEYSWNFVPINNGNDFMIKNKRYGEYLYADGVNFHINRDRRFIYTFRQGYPVGKMLLESKWSLIC